MKTKQLINLGLAVVIVVLGGSSANAGLVGSTATISLLFQLTPDGEVLEFPFGSHVVSETEIEIPDLRAYDEDGHHTSVDIGDDYFELNFMEQVFPAAGHQHLGIIQFENVPPIQITSATLAASNTLDLMPEGVS